MTESTLRSFDSDLRWECWGDAGMKGKECRRFTAGGEAEGDTRGDAEGDIDEDAEDVTSAHAAVVSGKNPPALLLHEFFPSLLLSSSGVVDVRGLGLAEGVLAITDNGGRMLKILSSAGGGPYESKGSGTVCSIGSMTGSELWRLLARNMRRNAGITYALAVNLSKTSSVDRTTTQTLPCTTSQTSSSCSIISW